MPRTWRQRPRREPAQAARRLLPHARVAGVVHGGPQALQDGGGPAPNFGGHEAQRLLRALADGGADGWFVCVCVCLKEGGGGMIWSVIVIF